MTKRSTSRPTLSFQQANAICRAFLPVGDEVFRYMARLRDSGFEAFIPRHEFVESFAETPEELEIHRRCVVENAKERLGQPRPIRISDEELKRVYFSPFLQKLREERDKVNGVPVNELSGRYPGGEAAWRSEVDPCRRRLTYAEVNHRNTYEQWWSATLDQERRSLEKEAARHATGLAKVHTFDNKGRYAFFVAVMERDAASLGFLYDELKSRPNYPIFSKAISNEWDLCWVIEESRFFLHSPFEGYFAPFLEIRSRNLRGSLANVQSGEFLHIRYAGVVPGFFNGYWKFCNLDELETVIKAHLHLYSLMAPIIEESLPA